MNEILVISKGAAQSKSFEKYMNDYTEKNALPLKWTYATEKDYTDVLEANDVKLVIISPEVILVEAKIKAELESRNVKYIVIKPAAFGLKQTEKFMPDVLNILGL